MTPDLQQAVLENARNAARAYARGRPWADVEELTQEAVCAQLEAAKRYDPGRGVPFAGYAWRVAVLALLRYVLYNSSPVTCKGGRRWKDNLKAARAASWHVEDRDERNGIDPEAALREGALDPALRVRFGDSDAADGAHLRRVHERVVELLGPEEAAFAFGLLADGWRPREVAADHGVTPRRVGKDLRRTKGKLRADPELRALWEDMS